MAIHRFLVRYNTRPDIDILPSFWALDGEALLIDREWNSDWDWNIDERGEKL